MFIKWNFAVSKLSCYCGSMMALHGPCPWQCPWTLIKESSPQHRNVEKSHSSSTIVPAGDKPRQGKSDLINLHADRYFTPTSEESSDIPA